MPEGHLIHRLAEDHFRELAGQTVAVSSPQGRFAGLADFLDGRRVTRVDAIGKHLLYRFKGATLHIHLGLRGSFKTEPYVVLRKKQSVQLKLATTEKAFLLRQPLKCELLSGLQVDRLLRRLGPDPLQASADPERVWLSVRTSRTPIGSLLLDQSVIAGIGNIYRSEILYRLKIHPNRSASSLTRTEFDLLWNTTVELLTIGKTYGRIITADPRIVGKPLEQMHESESTLVYQKQFCRTCHESIDSWELTNRTIYACPGCQRL